jgi:4,5:9,10-diseco-3-hydroxy-5,9,17-trioxoandrosta-1(10),2-diene-4-oate hydrolase
VTVDGLRTRYLEAGQGLEVLLLHGAALGTSAEVWIGNMERLAPRGLHLLAPDLPGYGLTDQPKDFSVSYRRRHIVKFMDALGIRKAALVGHSLAGNMVVQTAFELPDGVERIMVLGTGPLLPPMEGAAGGGGAAYEQVDSEPSLDETRAGLESTTFNTALITPELVARRHELSLGKNFEAQRARQQMAPEPPVSPPFWQRLDKIPVPARFLYGRDDRGNAGLRAELAREKYPNLDLHLFDHCKHMVQWDKAAEFEELATEFLLAHQGVAA